MSGADNATAAGQGDVVVVAVPWDGHAELLRDLAGQLAGKVVVDCVNPLGFDKQGAYPLPVEEGSAAEQAAALLPDSTVVGAFHHVSAVLLDDPEVATVDTDVLVLGEVREATELVRPWRPPSPACAACTPGGCATATRWRRFTANLISINRRYKAHSGIRVTDI